MAQLAVAGAQAIRTNDSPALHLSAYVHSLRELSIPIETRWKATMGHTPGQHARYVTACHAHVEVLT